MFTSLWTTMLRKLDPAQALALALALVLGLGLGLGLAQALALALEPAPAFRKLFLFVCTYDTPCATMHTLHPPPPCCCTHI